MKKIMNKAPKYLEDLFRPKEVNSQVDLRNSQNKLAVPLPRTDCYKQSISYGGSILWNTLDSFVREWQQVSSRKPKQNPLNPDVTFYLYVLFIRYILMAVLVFLYEFYICKNFCKAEYIYVCFSSF